MQRSNMEYLIVLFFLVFFNVLIFSLLLGLLVLDILVWIFGQGVIRAQPFILQPGVINGPIIGDSGE